LIDFTSQASLTTRPAPNLQETLNALTV